MYQALYRKYRPKSFEEVIGQEVIVKTLKNSIKNNIVTHAYLLSGPRGTGKTSIAKIFAKILNCYDSDNGEPCNKCISCKQANNNQNIDIIEIDAASNNGVDEIREIRNKISLVPTNSKYKIYIIDEVHMLTNQAFNALLKTLEEPPPHIIFIFATTEPQKIPKTILSRCQRFDYKKVNNAQIVEKLKYISKMENINITNEALYEIAKLSDGGVRDSISLLDQALAYSDDEISLNDIHEINGTLVKSELDDFILDILNKNLVETIKRIERYDSEGRNIIKIAQVLIERFKDCLLYLNAPELVDTTDEFYLKVKSANNVKDIYLYIKSLSTIINEMKNVNDSKLLFEIEFIKNMKESNDFCNNIENNHAKVLSNSVPISELKHENGIEKDIKQKKHQKVDEISKILYDKAKLENLKKIRIKNSLCMFSQKEREKIKTKFLALNEYLTDEENGKLISLLIDGELKSVSYNYLMFMYKADLMAESFNLEILRIEKLLEQIFNEKYKVIAINESDWFYIKDDYNKNKSNYKFEPEKIDINEIFNLQKNVKNTKTNSIDVMFDDIIEYE